MTLLSASARIAGRLGLTVEAATVDHRLRPESAAEVGLVARFAAGLGIVHHALEAPIAAGPGLEAGARAARYEVLEALRARRSLQWVVTAHSASDQAETVLMRLSRGASLGGAAGILERRDDRVLRPLLFATRAEIERYAQALQLPLVRDAMNDDPAFLRVRVRQEVLPRLVEAAGPGTERALARFAAQAAEDDAWLEAEAGRALLRVAWPDGTLEVEALASLGRPIARRVLARWLSGQGVQLDGALIDDALRAARDAGTATLPGDRVLSSTNGRVKILLAPARLHATSS
jgi:tRNA(Ile)-lysidine synthase